MKKWIRNNIVENKILLRASVIFNYFIKTLLSTILIISFCYLINNFAFIKNEFIDDHQWEYIKNYAVIDDFKDESIYKAEDYTYKQKLIYNYFNKKGSILADFSEFTINISKIRLKETNYSWERSMATVNPNYLNYNTIYDIKGNIIHINEKNPNYIVLIPEKYYSFESEILKKFKLWKNGYSEPVKSEKIEIIWIKSNQKIFSYNIAVNPNNENFVKDALLRVLTESNMSDIDYIYTCCYFDNPFKINESVESINDTLIDLDLYKYNPTVIPVSKLLADNSNKIRNMTQNIFTILLVNSIFIIFILRKNILIYYEMFKQRLVIQNIFGFNNIYKYLDYFVIILLNWVIVFNLTLLFLKYTPFLSIKNNLYLYFNIKEFVIITICLCIIEYILTIIFQSIIEKKNIPKYIKRGA